MDDPLRGPKPNLASNVLTIGPRSSAKVLKKELELYKKTASQTHWRVLTTNARTPVKITDAD